jgi:nicotinamide-nucleotide amidase
VSGGHTFDVAGLVARLSSAGLTVAVAESLTGGLVLATLTAAPGVSAVLRGGAVVYATDSKATQLDVDAELLEARGPVDPEVALAMARGVRHRWGADLGLATTGVAGPDPQDGHRVGEVYVAVADASDGRVEAVPVPHAGTAQVPGREEIRAASVRAALQLLDDWVGR